MKKIEFGKDGDNVTIMVDGKRLKTPFLLKVAKQAVKQGGPIVIGQILKQFTKRLEDDPVAILQTDDMAHIMKHIKKAIEE